MKKAVIIFLLTLFIPCAAKANMWFSDEPSFSPKGAFIFAILFVLLSPLVSSWWENNGKRIPLWQKIGFSWFALSVAAVFFFPGLILVVLFFPYLGTVPFLGLLFGALFNYLRRK